MKSFVVVFIVNIFLLINGDEIENKRLFSKALHRVYSDLISGKYSGSSDVNSFLTAKTDNYDNARCNKHLNTIMNLFGDETKSFELWALEMFDASGKVTDGIMYGNTYSYGNYDQCINIVAGDDEGGIKGQYCLTPIMFDLNTVISMGSAMSMMKLDPVVSVRDGVGGRANSVFVTMHGLCIPDTCEPTYFYQVFQSILLQSNLTLGPIIDPDLYCTIDNPIELVTIDIVAITIFTIVIVLMIASTAYDVYTTKTDQPKRDLFMAFSIVTNGARIFSVERSKSPDVMNCLNGIRVLSLVWIVMGHGYGLIANSAMNAIYVNEWFSNAFALIIVSSPVAVDSFFLLSGLLVTYNVFKEMKKSNGRLNVPMMYLHRYLRLTPPLAMLLLLTLSFVNHIGLGPVSKLIYFETEACDRYWWSYLLYLQNYVNPNEICLRHTWYLQVDMQLFILSPLVLIPLWKWGRKMLPVICTIMFLSVGCCFATEYINATEGGRLFYETHLRLGTWMIGVILAYAIIKTKHRKLEFPKWLVYGAWFLAIGMIVTVLFDTYDMNQPGHETTPIEAAMFGSLNRIVWCIALSWIIFACVKGFGGYINDFLSHPLWLPFARLSYSMYLLSLVLQIYRSKVSKTPKYFSDYYGINIFWGDIGLTFTLAIFWVLAFESPVPILEKVLFSRKPKPKPKTNESGLQAVEINT